MASVWRIQCRCREMMIFTSAVMQRFRAVTLSPYSSIIIILSAGRILSCGKYHLDGLSFCVSLKIQSWLRMIPPINSKYSEYNTSHDQAERQRDHSGIAVFEFVLQASQAIIDPSRRFSERGTRASANVF